MKTIIVDNHKWMPHKEHEKFSQFGGEWQSSDGDLVEIYIEKDKSGFEIHGLFSGITGSSIMYIDEIVISAIIEKSGKKYNREMSFEEQCCICADYICSKFMTCVDLKKHS